MVKGFQMEKLEEKMAQMEIKIHELQEQVRNLQKLCVEHGLSKEHIQQVQYAHYPSRRLIDVQLRKI